jgi:hypothetical protein
LSYKEEKFEFETLEKEMPLLIKESSNRREHAGYKTMKNFKSYERITEIIS